MKSRNRPHKIAIQRPGTPEDDGYTTIPGAWATWCMEYAAIYYGTGTEQRQAAQEQAAQAATFEVLSNSKTRAVSVGDRVCYPVTDANPDNWPAWDITAHNDLGYNDGVRISAVRAAR